MELRRRDAHLGAQTQLPAIIESGGRVPQDARGVHFLEEALGTLSILGNDRRGTADLESTRSSTLPSPTRRSANFGQASLAAQSSSKSRVSRALQTPGRRTLELKTISSAICASAERSM